jgi:hypothetical protein
MLLRLGHAKFVPEYREREEGVGYCKAETIAHSMLRRESKLHVGLFRMGKGDQAPESCSAFSVGEDFRGSKSFLED